MHEHTQVQREDYCACNPEIATLPYDPDAARKTVEARGGVAFDVLVIGGSSFEQMAIALRAQLAGAGVEVAVAAHDFGTVQRRVASGEFQALLQQMNQGVDPVDTINR